MLEDEYSYKRREAIDVTRLSGVSMKDNAFDGNSDETEVKYRLHGKPIDKHTLPYNISITYTKYAKAAKERRSASAW